MRFRSTYTIYTARIKAVFRRASRLLVSLQAARKRLHEAPHALRSTSSIAAASMLEILSALTSVLRPGANKTGCGDGSPEARRTTSSQYEGVD